MKEYMFIWLEEEYDKEGDLLYDRERYEVFKAKNDKEAKQIVKDNKLKSQQENNIEIFTVFTHNVVFTEEEFEND